MPDQPTYRSHVLDHLGLVAGMFDALSLGDITLKCGTSRWGKRSKRWC